jgi:hypothetical protein
VICKVRKSFVIRKIRYERGGGVGGRREKDRVEEEKEKEKVKHDRVARHTSIGRIELEMARIVHPKWIQIKGSGIPDLKR